MKLLAILAASTIGMTAGCKDDPSGPSDETVALGVAGPKNNPAGACRPDILGDAQLTNNFGLDSFCMDYVDHGNGMVTFKFLKTTPDGSRGEFHLTVPQTEVGKSWDYNTKEVIADYTTSEQGCRMLLSPSRYPPVRLIGQNNTESIDVESFDCSQSGYFSVKLSAVEVAFRGGDYWSYDLDARFTPQEGKEPYFLAGRFRLQR